MPCDATKPTVRSGGAVVVASHSLSEAWSELVRLLYAESVSTLYKSTSFAIDAVYDFQGFCKKYVLEFPTGKLAAKIRARHLTFCFLSSFPPYKHSSGMIHPAG
jgi:hypothetical protein